MSGFLTRLAARTLGVGAIAQSRPLSRYETDTLGASPFVESVDETPAWPQVADSAIPPTGREASAHADPPPAPRSPGLEPARVDPPLPDRPRQDASRPAPPPSPVLSSPVSHAGRTPGPPNRGEPTRPGPVDRTAPGAPSPTLAQAPAPVPAAAAPVAVQRRAQGAIAVDAQISADGTAGRAPAPNAVRGVAPAESPSSSAAAPPLAPPAAPQPPPEPPAARVVRVPAVETRVHAPPLREASREAPREAAADVAPQVSAPRVSAPQVPPPHASVPPPAPLAPHPRAEPAVQSDRVEVTIGRIEVRAPAPPPPAPSQPARTAADRIPSLADYLSRGRG